MWARICTSHNPARAGVLRLYRLCQTPHSSPPLSYDSIASTYSATTSLAGVAGIEPAMRESKSRALTAWLHPYGKEQGRSRCFGPAACSGVGEGTRTLDTRNHNPMLYQLNYIHHGTGAPTVWLYGKKQSGTPGVWPVRERPVARSPAKVPPEEDAPQARPIRVRGFD